MTDSPPVVINGTFTKWSLGIFASLILAAVAWSVATMQEHDQRLVRLMEFRAATEANRFTPADGVEMMRELRAYHDQRTPSPEILLRVQSINSRLDAIEARILGHTHEEPQ
jgi:hypothetical protein